MKSKTKPKEKKWKPYPKKKKDPSKKKATRRKKPVNPESEEYFHIQFVEWVRKNYPDVFIQFSAGENKFKSKRLGAMAGYKKRVMGYTKGTPDLFFAVPKGRYPGFYMELKSKKGVASPEQLQCIEQLKDAGYRCEIVYGDLDVACEMFETYMNLPPVGRTKKRRHKREPIIEID